jgi:serine/threonine protein kinase
MRSSSELGTGGMATVYLGRALSVAGFQRLVAIKYLHPHLLRDETFVQMFLDEGRLAARIHHPNVVGTLDLEHSPEGLYIVSEYIEGDQLLGLFRAARDQNGRIPVGITVRIMLDALAGLHAAHELTDDLGASLKHGPPGRVAAEHLVGADGISRITDFGIAKAEERIASTRDGIVKGKLSYMAPEQPNDLPIDRRTDVFSAATVLWECLTGRRLFPGKTDGEVLQGLLNKPILHLREVDPEYSTALDDVLAKALARNIEDRFDTASDFADALEVAAIPLGIATPREVARHVKEIASEKLTEVKQRRRAMTTRDLPVFRGSSAPPPPASSTPSGVHTIVTASAAPAAVDEAPTQLQSSPLAAEPEPARPALPPLPRAAPALPARKTSRPDTPALPSRDGDASAEPPVPELAATTLPSLVAPPPLDHVALPPPPLDHVAVAPPPLDHVAVPPPPLDPEAPTLASITPPLPASRLVPEPLAFAPPPRGPSRAPSSAPSMPPRRSSRALLLLLVVCVGVVLGLVIYRFTVPETTPPLAGQPALTPTTPAPAPMAPAPPPMAPPPAVVAEPAAPASVAETPRPVEPPRPAAPSRSVTNVRPTAAPRTPPRPSVPATPAPRPSAETPAPTPPPAARESDLPTAI